MVKITVGIPVKNSETTIAGCLKSVLNAELDKYDIEIIIVDGGSKDRTLEIVQRFLEDCDFEYRLFYDESRGIAYARQMIVDDAGGQYIAWVDSDNTVSNDFFVKSLSVLEHFPDVGATHPMLVPMGSNHLAERLQIYYLRARERNKSKQNKNSLRPLGMQGTICRVKAIAGVGGFDLKLLAGEDIDLFMRMDEEGWKISLAPTYVHYYVRGSWHDAFSQAIWWGYGRCQVSTKYPGRMHRLIRFVNRRTGMLPIEYIADVLRTTITAAGIFGTSETLMIPIYYFYRRVGYFWGNKLAKRVCCREESTKKLNKNPE